MKKLTSRRDMSNLSLSHWKYQLLTFEVSTKKRKLIVPTSGINNKTPVSEPGPKDIIKHPSDLNLPVIEKSSLYVRKAYVDIYELLTRIEIERLIKEGEWDNKEFIKMQEKLLEKLQIKHNPIDNKVILEKLSALEKLEKIDEKLEKLEKLDNEVGNIRKILQDREIVERNNF
ncbi:hypothetical protein RhiirA4_550424 [Rhizophagus irregularis]|uniref:Uncharacterized protein n=1 Tax=Rhizophagus irregularis TaxID=588596 RepID=A0A2I1HL89_9GLOM|nr:hypothetical protein RhiirA4_550424 [Rhizophagus irregularis]